MRPAYGIIHVHAAEPFHRRPLCAGSIPQQRAGRHPRRRPAADRGRRRHRQDGHAGAPRGLADRPGRRSGPDPAADLHPPGGRRDAPPRGRSAAPAARRRRAAGRGQPLRGRSASGAAPSTPSPRGCCAATARRSACRRSSPSTTGPIPRTC